METKYYVISETPCGKCGGEGTVNPEMTCPVCLGEGTHREEVELTSVIRQLCTQGKIERQKLRGMETA